MENPFASRGKGFSFQDIQTQELDDLVTNLIFDDDEEDIFSSFFNSPSTSDILFTQYGLSNPQSTSPFEGFSQLHSQDQTPSFNALESSNFGLKRSVSSQLYSLSGSEKIISKRSKVNSVSSAIECSTIPRSLSHLLDEKMYKALSLLMEFSGEGVLAQFWSPIKTRDHYILSTCDQAYLLDSRLSRYREVSRKFTFSAEANQDSYYHPGLPGRVFISGVTEWTSNVMYYKTDEYLRMKHALDNDVRGSIAIPVLDEFGGSCCGVLELVTCKEKPNFDLEMDSVCRALQAVNLQTSTIPRRQYISSNQKQALAEIRNVLKAVCHKHKLPLALVWIPCSYSKETNNELVKIYAKSSLLCIEETSCYVNDIEMEGFVNACLEHYLKEGQGIVGKALISNKPCFAFDVRMFNISEYPLVQHARKYGLSAGVATKVKSTFTGEDDYILEFFLPLSMKESSEQQLLLESILSMMQRICQTLRIVSDGESNEVREMSNLPQVTLLNTDIKSTRSTFLNMSSAQRNDIAGSQGNRHQEIKGVRRSEKRKSSTEKNVSLNVLQQYFSGSLKDAAKSLGVCPTTLKRICRQHGIMRWPSRKINKVNRSLKKLQTVLDSVKGVEGGLRFDSVTREFIAVSPPNSSSHNDDSVVRIQEDIKEDATLQILKVSSEGSLMEPWEQSSLNYSNDFDIPKESEEMVKKDKDHCVQRCLSSLALNEDVKNTKIECGHGTSEPNLSISSSMSDSSNSSGPVLVRTSSTSIEHDWNQTRTNNISRESESTLTIKATYKDNTIRFKLDPYFVGCSQLYKEVGKRFKLQDDTFQLKYLDDDEEWVMLVTDSDLHECLEILNSMKKDKVKFLVCELHCAAIGSSGGSNMYLGTCP